jgi:hypothetical protein
MRKTVEYWEDVCPLRFFSSLKGMKGGGGVAVKTTVRPSILTHFWKHVRRLGDAWLPFFPLYKMNFRQVDTGFLLLKKHMFNFATD